MLVMVLCSYNIALQNWQQHFEDSDVGGELAVVVPSCSYRVEMKLNYNGKFLTQHTIMNMSCCEMVEINSQCTINSGCHTTTATLPEGSVKV